MRARKFCAGFDETDFALLGHGWGWQRWWGTLGKTPGARRGCLRTGGLHRPDASRDFRRVRTADRCLGGRHLDYLGGPFEGLQGAGRWRLRFSSDGELLTATHRTPSALLSVPRP